MKRLRLVFVIAAILGMFSLALGQVDTLTILHVNDTHSHLLSYGPKDSNGDWTWGGMARIATLVGMNRMTEPNVMLFHSGDLFVGDFMFQEYLGIAELEIMKALNYDALELGNHEFDLYPQTLEYVLNQAGFPSQGFPVLCANLDITGEPQLGYFVQPYTIKEIGGLRIGIFGLMTDLTNQISNPSPVVVTPPLAVAQGWVDSLRNGLGCDMVFLVSHMGVDYDQMAAATISGIDVIIGGHTHTLIPTPIQIGNTLVVQAGEFGRYIGKLKIITDNGVVQSHSYELLSVDATVPAEPTLAGMISNLAAGVEADPRFGPVYTDVVARASTELKKQLTEGLCRDNAMGNMLSDAFRNLTGTDIAIQPQGFISQTIYEGAVKGSDIFQAVPYGFDQQTGLGLKLVTFQTTGASLMAGLEFSVYNLPYVEDFFLHVSNLSYVYNSSNPPGSRVDYSSIKINGHQLDPSAIISVTVPDAVVPFFSQIPGFEVMNLTPTDYFIYNVTKDFIVAHSPVAYYAEGRVLDLASYADPATGADQLSDVVALFRENGTISRRNTAEFLQRTLYHVRERLEDGHNHSALAGLELFKLHVRLEKRARHITAFSAEQLIYLADKLMYAIRHQNGRHLIAGDNIEQPEQFQLNQNYPNPFNPETNISYSLPQGANVRLTIYDILGQEIRVLVDEYQNPGEKNIIWDGHNMRGEDVSSGIYFYRLLADDYTQTKKMSLLR